MRGLMIEQVEPPSRVAHPHISPISPYISPISPYSISRISQDAMARYADTVQVCVLVEG